MNGYTRSTELRQAMGALYRAARDGGMEQHDLAAWETVNAAINRLQLEQLIERCAWKERMEAVQPIIAAARHRIDGEGWCIVCGGGLEHTFATDDNPEGLEFRHRDGCALVALDALTAAATREAE